MKSVMFGYVIFLGLLILAFIIARLNKGSRYANWLLPKERKVSAAILILSAVAVLAGGISALFK